MLCPGCVLHGQAYGLRGTPSVVVFDQAGRVQLIQFDQVDDLQLGVVIGQLLTLARPQTSMNVASR